MTETTESLAEEPGRQATRRRVLQLALPVLGEQLLIYTVGLFDTWLAGTIDAGATAAIGLAAYVSWLATLLFALVATGTHALVARHWGAGETDRGNHTFNQALPLGLAVGLCGGLLIGRAAPLLATLQNMEGPTHALVVRYLQIDALSYAFLSVNLVCTAALRGTGDMRTPLAVLGLVNVVNIVASCLLRFGWGPIPAWGADGIVAGTVLARACGAMLFLTLFLRGHSGLRFPTGAWPPERAALGRILRIGVPAGLDGALTWTGHFLFLMVIAHLADGPAGRIIFAAHVIGIQVEALTYLPAVAWGAAAGTTIGQALGAGDLPRARSAGHIAVLQCGLLGLAAATIYYTAADPIYTLMHHDPAVRVVGAPALRFLACFQLPLVVLVVYTQALRGAGDTRAPLLITVVGVLCVRVPLAYLCGIVLGGGLIGAWIGMCTDVALRAVLTFFRYRRGDWIHARV